MHWFLISDDGLELDYADYHPQHDLLESSSIKRDWRSVMVMIALEAPLLQLGAAVTMAQVASVLRPMPAQDAMRWQRVHRDFAPGMPGR